jgi:hypothetical protein
LAGRSRSTFGKRLKETKRLEKRQEKAARKDERKQGPGGAPIEAADEPSPGVIFRDLHSFDDEPGNDR